MSERRLGFVAIMKPQVAFVNLKRAERRAFNEFVSLLQDDDQRSTKPRDKHERWLKPGITASVRYLRGEQGLRHASIIGVNLDKNVLQRMES